MNINLNNSNSMNTIEIYEYFYVKYFSLYYKKYK